MSEILTFRPSSQKRALAGALLLAGSMLQAGADTVLGSKHDLSVYGPGPVKATSESEVCLFCHTPHRGSGSTPLWNHALSQASYTPYSSSTAKATIGQPTGSSKLCLSCHDGTVALGMVHSRPNPIQISGGISTMPAGKSNLGTDLSDDHPISFTYDDALVGRRGELRDPNTLVDQVKLDHNSQVQCTSCHNPHDDQFGKFLVQDNYASALCLACHDTKYWEQSSHKISSKAWNGAGLDPWPNTERNTVAANACENCHAPHNAGTKPRLMTFPMEEQNCFSCHSGTVASKNLQTDFNKLSIHPILDSSQVHDPLEDPYSAPRHVECADCHNPHAARSQSAIAPNASGALAGVKGINDIGTVVDPVQYEYEVCYRCHADTPGRGQAYVNRQFSVTNTRLEFQPMNASFHPIQAPGKNPNVPSLLVPWTTSSRMYCTDCHNSDQSPSAGGTGANGPHGSMFRPILERQLLVTDFASENPGTYALCYKCHSRTSILSDASFSYHQRHVVEEQTACTTCHDPHGVATVKNLINFNVNYVRPSSNGRLEYQSTGNRSGNCSLTCHGADHQAESYGPNNSAPLPGLSPAKSLKRK